MLAGEKGNTEWTSTELNSRTVVIIVGVGIVTLSYKLLKIVQALIANPQEGSPE